MSDDDHRIGQSTKHGTIAFWSEKSVYKINVYNLPWIKIGTEKVAITSTSGNYPR